MRAFSRKITFFAFFPKTEKNGQKKMTWVKKPQNGFFFCNSKKPEKPLTVVLPLLQTKYPAI